MLKYFILILISCTCFASEPKFHYMDCVKIISGFYKNCQGNVVDYNEQRADYTPWYLVEVNDCKNHSFTYDFRENELEGCKK